MTSLQIELTSEALQAVFLAADRKGIRTYLNGVIVNLSENGDKVNYYATDGHRIHAVSQRIAGPSHISKDKTELFKPFFLPCEKVAELLKGIGATRSRLIVLTIVKSKEFAYKLQLDAKSIYVTKQEAEKANNFPLQGILMNLNAKADAEQEYQNYSSPYLADVASAGYYLRLETPKRTGATSKTNTISTVLEWHNGEHKVRNGFTCLLNESKYQAYRFAAVIMPLKIRKNTYYANDISISECGTYLNQPL